MLAITVHYFAKYAILLGALRVSRSRKAFTMAKGQNKRKEVKKKKASAGAA